MHWFYESGGSQQGPYSQEEIRRVILSGGIARETLVWKGDMPGWLPAGQTELAAYFPGVAQAPKAPPAPARVKPSKLPTPSGLKTLWLWVVIADCAPYGLVLLRTALGIPSCGDPDSRLSAVVNTVLVLSPVVVFMGALALNCVLLYKLWRTIQDGQARTSPGNAVSFCFYPFFNLYWFFQAIWGLSKDMNSYADQRGIPAPRINEGLGLIISVLMCALLVLHLAPQLGMGSLYAGLSLVTLVLTIIFWKQAVNAACAIVRAKS